MNTANNRPLLNCFRHLTGDPQSKPSDGDLLPRYLDRREETVFAAQPMAR